MAGNRGGITHLSGTAGDVTLEGCARVFRQKTKKKAIKNPRYEYARVLCHSMLSAAIKDGGTLAQKKSTVQRRCFFTHRALSQEPISAPEVWHKKTRVVGGAGFSGFCLKKACCVSRCPPDASQSSNHFADAPANDLDQAHSIGHVGADLFAYILAEFLGQLSHVIHMQDA